VVWQVETDPDPGLPVDEVVVALESGARPPFGLITTQTCDLFEEGTRQKQPWFSVAPVYDITEVLKNGQLAQIDRGEIGHIVHLTGERFANGIWVADLRIEVPVEKGWLVGRDPIGGFAERDEYLVLAARLAKRKGRPAISTEVTKALRKPLLEWLKGAGKPYRSEIHSIRVEAAGDLTTSKSAGLLVVSEADELSEKAKEAWNTWEKAVMDAAAKVGVTVFPSRHGSQDTMTARDVFNSVPIDVDFLS